MIMTPKTVMFYLTEIAQNMFKIIQVTVLPHSKLSCTDMDKGQCPYSIMNG
jgi:hypothetical protein